MHDEGLRLKLPGERNLSAGVVRESMQRPYGYSWTDADVHAVLQLVGSMSIRHRPRVRVPIRNQQVAGSNPANGSRFEICPSHWKQWLCSLGNPNITSCSR